jgi:hypothetical protein
MAVRTVAQKTLDESESVARGAKMAARFFELRSEGRGWRNVEVHLSEKDLATLLALAFEAGAVYGRTP